jgi:hypothetical protein
MAFRPGINGGEHQDIDKHFGERFTLVTIDIPASLAEHLAALRRHRPSMVLLPSLPPGIDLEHTDPLPFRPDAEALQLAEHYRFDYDRLERKLKRYVPTTGHDMSSPYGSPLSGDVAAYLPN